MPVSTVSQSGPISSASTFGGVAFSNGNSIVNLPAGGFTLTIDQDSTVAGMGSAGSGTGNGTTIVNSGVTLTLTGNVIQGNAGFTLGSGTGDAHLVFDCTAADRKFLFGDAADFSTYANCGLIGSGTSGAHCTVTKTGANDCWFDDFSENSGGGADKSGYDCTYTDFTGIGKSDGSLSLGISTFGNKNIRFSFCTFDQCATTFIARPYGWSGSANKDFYLRDTRWTNPTGSFASAIQIYGGNGSGAFEVKRCSFAGAANITGNMHLQNNWFGRSANWTGGPYLSFTGNLVRVGSGDAEVTPLCDSTDCYWLAGLDHPGNPHCLTGPIPGGTTIANWIFEYPLVSQIDSGECVYANASDLRVYGCLAIPSETDGFAIGNICHHVYSSAQVAWTCEHNTCVGANNAFIAYSEASGDDPPLIGSLRSNLVVDPSGNAARLVKDISLAQTDMVAPANAEYNGKFGQFAYADPTCGQTLQGYESHFTTAPGAHDIIGDPQFVDPTRNFARWAVHKGAASGGDSLAVRTAASVALVFADPSLIASDLIPWIRDGFAPTNPVYQNAGHDGVTTGAIEFTSGISLVITETTLERGQAGQTLHCTLSGATSSSAGDWTLTVGASSGSVTGLTSAGSTPVLTVTAPQVAGSALLTHTPSGASANITVSDTIAPSSPTGVVASSPTLATFSVPLSFTLPSPSPAGETVTATLRRNATIITTGQTTSPYTFTGVVNGDTLKVRSVDNAGNESTDASVVFVAPSAAGGLLVSAGMAGGFQQE